MNAKPLISSLMLAICTRVVPVDNLLIYHDIFTFHRPAESEKNWFINEID